jgi:predicted secreted protein
MVKRGERQRPSLECDASQLVNSQMMIHFFFRQTFKFRIQVSTFLENPHSDVCNGSTVLPAQKTQNEGFTDIRGQICISKDPDPNLYPHRSKPQ